MKVMIFTVASAGNGHNKTAENIKKYLNKNYKDAEVQIVDTLNDINPIIDKVFIGSYLKTIKSVPTVYKSIYKLSNDNSSILNITEFFYKLFSNKIKEMINTFNPDVILCTHPFSAEIISVLKGTNHINAKTFVILTDYSIHSIWLYDNIDYYIIAEEDLKEELISRGIEENKIYPYGIPVDIKFSMPLNKNIIKEKYHIDKDKPVIVLMGGGLGIGRIKENFKSILLGNIDCKIVVCCGSNKKLKKSLEYINSGIVENKADILGFTENIDELLSIADVVITKPGGITISECLIKQVPMIITSAIPGQEEENADYLLNCGIAVRVKKDKDLIPKIKEILYNKKRISYIKEMEKDKSKPDALKNICDLIYNKK